MGLDNEAQKRFDSILEHELAIGFRVKELPEEYQAQILAFGLTPVSRVKLTRMNPSRRRKLNEAVQRAYHRDLQNKDILSNEQIMKLVVDRGEWSPEKDKRVKELQARTNSAMSQLYIDGFTDESTEWANELVEHTDTFRKALENSQLSEEDKATVDEVFTRWVEFSPEKQEEYTKLYSESQGNTRYSPERDSMFVCDKLPDLSVVDAVTAIEEILDKVQRFLQMNEERAELAALQIKRATIFADSVESRRENAEEMARLYFTCESIDEHGNSKGPITSTFDQLWDMPDDVIQWLLVESYFFHNGIPDETRPYLETFGFIRGGTKENTESEPSDESLAPPSSNLDSLPAEETAENSSES